VRSMHASHHLFLGRKLVEVSKYRWEVGGKLVGSWWEVGKQPICVSTKTYQKYLLHCSFSKMQWYGFIL
jgi:hypothetical protein